MTNGNGAPPEQAPPQLNVLAQYTKDLSFENPNAPSSLAAAAAAAGDQHPDQRFREQSLGKRVRSDAFDRGQG
jgi:preprotein translocase subunit SecB